MVCEVRPVMVKMWAFETGSQERERAPLRLPKKVLLPVARENIQV